MIDSFGRLSKINDQFVYEYKKIILCEKSDEITCFDDTQSSYKITWEGLPIQFLLMITFHSEIYFSRVQEITVFVPAWRKESSKPDSPTTAQHILAELERERYAAPRD